VWNRLQTTALGLAKPDMPIHNQCRHCKAFRLRNSSGNYWNSVLAEYLWWYQVSVLTLLFFVIYESTRLQLEASFCDSIWLKSEGKTTFAVSASTQLQMVSHFWDSIRSELKELPIFTAYAKTRLQLEPRCQDNTGDDRNKTKIFVQHFFEYKTHILHIFPSLNSRNMHISKIVPTT
jgi:hypothetical protein